MPAESELFKDKIEVSLDGRQIFYLFFGGAVIVALVFVLGVMVGKRVEARAHIDRTEASPARDPLAALDALGQEDDLTFPRALIGGAGDGAAGQLLGAIDEELFAGARDAEPSAGAGQSQAPDVAEQARADKAAADKARAEKARADRADKAKAEKARADKARADKAKAEKARADKAKAEKAKAEKARAEKAKADKARADKALADAANAGASQANNSAGASQADDNADRPEAKRKSVRFTLQLSSFRERAEADSFYDKLKTAGFDPYIVEAEVAGKGMWYRVRLGHYSSYEAAIKAKKEFEASQHIIAYVTRVKSAG